MSTDPNRLFDGQYHTDDGERGKTEIKGVRFRDLCDCITKAFVHAAAHTVENEGELREKVETNTICRQDLYQLDLSRMDPGTLIKNISCEVERFMGIFPNIPTQHTIDMPVYKTDVEPTLPPCESCRFVNFTDSIFCTCCFNEMHK